MQDGSHRHKKRKRDSGSKAAADGTPPGTSTTSGGSSGRKKGGDGPSPFEETNLALCISLLPSCLTDPVSAIRRNVYKLLMAYNTDVGGVIVALTDLRFPEGEQHGVIMEEMPHIHFKIEATAVVFRPRAGVALEGRIMKVSSTHVSMLVFGIFNASVYAHEMEGAGYAWSAAAAQWRHVETGAALSIGGSLEFTVRRTHQAQGIISVEGVLSGNGAGAATVERSVEQSVEQSVEWSAEREEPRSEKKRKRRNGEEVDGLSKKKRRATMV